MALVGDFALLAVLILKNPQFNICIETLNLQNTFTFYHLSPMTFLWSRNAVFSFPHFIDMEMELNFYK